MSFTKKCLATAVAASTMAFGAVAPVANAEVSGSVGIASSYLFRGVDLGPGTPAVWGDLSYSNSGFYGGVWASSGDTTVGTEYDVYVGYSNEIGDFSYDIGVVNYVYPEVADGGDFGDVSEAYLSLGYGPVSFSYYDNIAGATGYEYYSLSAEFGAFSALIGLNDNEDDDADDPVHLDVSYAYNDNLSFTLSQQIADEAETDDLKFVVGYSIPIGE